MRRPKDFVFKIHNKEPTAAEEKGKRVKRLNSDNLMEDLNLNEFEENFENPST